MQLARLAVRETTLAAASGIDRFGVLRSATFASPDVIMAVDQADVVSFDVFDTLIVRALADPKDLFYLLGEPAADARSMRVRYEEMARRKAASEGRGEVTLREIYRTAEIEGAENVADLELRLERKFCRPHGPAVALFRRLVDLGKPPVIISDTYLSTSQVELLLRANGIEGWSSLFVSSDHSRTKRSGELFDTALDHTASGKDWLHIGDTLVPDVVRSRQRGLRAVYVPRLIDQLSLEIPTLRASDHWRDMGLVGSVFLGLSAMKFCGGAIGTPWAEVEQELDLMKSDLERLASRSTTLAEINTTVVRDLLELSPPNCAEAASLALLCGHASGLSVPLRGLRHLAGALR